MQVGSSLGKEEAEAVRKHLLGQLHCCAVSREWLQLCDASRQLLPVEPRFLLSAQALTAQVGRRLGFGGVANFFKGRRGDISSSANISNGGCGAQALGAVEGESGALVTVLSMRDSWANEESCANSVQLCPWGTVVPMGDSSANGGQLRQ